MDRKEKVILNRIYITLASISWKTQTFVAQEKWREVDIMFKELDISLKEEKKS